MTSLAPTEPDLHADAGAPSAARSRWQYVEHAAMLGLLGFWAVPFTRAQGGRGVHHELLFAALMVPVLLAQRVWRAPTGSALAAAGVALAAVLVCVFSPSGWYGADVAVGYVLAASVYLSARRYAREDDRRYLLAATVCLAGLYQFEQSFIAWWGSRNPATEMSGTFYWHNPYAAFLFPGAVIGLGLAATGRSPWRYVGWASAPVCGAGIVFSSSRATLVVLVVAWIAVLAASALQRATLIRVVGVIALALGLVLVLPGPPFFPHRTSPLSATTARSDTGETLAQDGYYRTEFWRSSIAVAFHRPLVGGGYHNLAKASALYTPSGWARSPLAHNGYLQPLSDGGLLLGVPFLVAVMVVVLWAFRRFLSLLRRLRGRQVDVTELSVVLALLGALAHSAVDFDWSHPSILVEAALLAACVAPGVRRPDAAHPRRWRNAVTGASVVALGGLLVMCVPALHQWQLDEPSGLDSTASLLADARAPFGDYRPADIVLLGYVGQVRSATPAQVSSALRLTAADAAVDIHLALLRDAAAAQIGTLPDAISVARAEMAQVDGSIAPYVPDLARVMIAAGDLGSARGLLRGDLQSQIAARALAPDAGYELETWAARLGRGAGYACLVQGISSVGGSDAVSSLPASTRACRRHLDQGPPQ